MARRTVDSVRTIWVREDSQQAVGGVFDEVTWAMTSAQTERERVGIRRPLTLPCLRPVDPLALPSSLRPRPSTQLTAPTPDEQDVWPGCLGPCLGP